MTLAQIMTLALRQLDEDPQDISEYDDLFRVYANQGYDIAMREYVKPRKTNTVRSDENGDIYLEPDIVRIVELREADAGRRRVHFDLAPDGESVHTAYKEKAYDMLCVYCPPGMDRESDEPAMLSKEAHSALADYICFRHLSNGNMAKQSKAQFYQAQYYQAMQRLRPHGFGSVTGYKNLYTATDVRYVR